MKCELCNKELTNMGGYICHKKYCEKTIHLKSEVINLYVNDYKSIKEINNITGLSKNKICEYLNGLNRNPSESSKLAHRKYPNNFKHTDETKKKIREKHLEWMKNNPEKTAWRISNFSYPEKLLFNKFLELKWDEKYLIIREKSVFPYFLDFAFENEKVDIEVDGSQHLLPERKESDEKRDKILIDCGWLVIRLSENEVKNNIENCINIIQKTIKNRNISSKLQKVGLFKEIKKYIRQERNKNGLTEKQIQGILNQRKINRPPYDVLINEVKEFGYVGVGKKYGVSDNSIRKWIKFYNARFI